MGRDPRRLQTLEGHPFLPTSKERNEEEGVFKDWHKPTTSLSFFILLYLSKMNLPLQNSTKVREAHTFDKIPV